MIESGIDFSRTAPAAWSRDLARLAPRSDSVNWLHVAWYAGDPWEPVERWIVYEMTPFATVAASQAHQRQFGFDDEWFLALTGPNPRTLGHYDAALGAYVSDGLPAVIDRRQWVLFRELGAFARPVWICQGASGGHKRAFTGLELRYLRAEGYPWDAAPAPGELDYAEFDGRTLDQLARLDRLRQWNHRARSWRDRTIEDTFKARAQAEVQFLKLFGTWLDTQMAGMADAIGDILRLQGHSVNDLPYAEPSDQEREAADLAFESPETVTV